MWSHKGLSVLEKEVEIALSPYDLWLLMPYTLLIRVPEGPNFVH